MKTIAAIRMVAIDEPVKARAWTAGSDPLLLNPSPATFVFFFVTAVGDAPAAAASLARPLAELSEPTVVVAPATPLLVVDDCVEDDPTEGSVVVEEVALADASAEFEPEFDPEFPPLEVAVAAAVVVVVSLVAATVVEVASVVATVVVVVVVANVVVVISGAAGSSFVMVAAAVHLPESAASYPHPVVPRLSARA